MNTSFGVIKWFYTVNRQIYTNKGHGVDAYNYICAQYENKANEKELLFGCCLWQFHYFILKQV